MGTSAASMTTLCKARGCRCEKFERFASFPVPYVLRHTFASNGACRGRRDVPARKGHGTSLEMIARTYGHLVRGADDAFRSRLDAFAAGRDERAELAR